MMYQLQEQALIKKAAKEAADKVVGVVYEVKTPKKTVAKPAKKPPRVVAKPKPPAVILPFRRLPTKLEPNAFDLLAELPPIAIEQYIFSIHASRVIINLDDERIHRRKKKRKLAAFLLMAA